MTDKKKLAASLGFDDDDLDCKYKFINKIIVDAINKELEADLNDDDSKPSKQDAKSQSAIEQKKPSQQKEEDDFLPAFTSSRPLRQRGTRYVVSTTNLVVFPSLQ